MAQIGDEEINHLDVNKLDSNTAERYDLDRKVMAFVESHLKDTEERRKPAYRMTKDEGAGILEHPIGETPKNIDMLLSVLDKHLLGNGFNQNHDGHMAYIPGGSIYAAALGDYIAAATDRFAAVFSHCPGAVRVENMLISWVASLFGYPEGHAGNIASGASTSMLMALVVARHSKRLKSRDFERLVVYVTDMCHICVQAGLNTAGLFEAIIRKVPMDEDFRMNADELRRLVTKDKQAGLLPFVVVASLGTTAVGAVDPIDIIADVAEEHDLWFCVDAAYGGFFVLVDECKPLFKGIERADAIVVDPHKGLFLPKGIGMLLVKDGQKLRDCFTVFISYLPGDSLNMEANSPINLSFEITKHFRGLRMWLPLQLYGVQAFRDSLEEKIFLSRYLYQKLSEIPNVVTGRPPQLTVITFYCDVGTDEENEIFNTNLLTEILNDGSFYLTSIPIQGKLCLRVCPIHNRSHKDSIDRFLMILQEKIGKLAAQNNHIN